MKPSYWIVIVSALGEPMGVEANDAADIRRALGDCALIAPTTKAAPMRAGWDDESIYRPGDAMVAEEAA